MSEWLTMTVPVNYQMGKYPFFGLADIDLVEVFHVFDGGVNNEILNCKSENTSEDWLL